MYKILVAGNNPKSFSQRVCILRFFWKKCTQFPVISKKSILRAGLLLCFHFYAACESTHAALHVVILISAPDKNQTMPRYHQSAQTIHDAIKNYNQHPKKLDFNQLDLILHIFAQNRQPRWEIDGVFFGPVDPKKKPFLSLDDLNEVIKRIKLKAQLSQEKESTLIVILGHGRGSNSHVPEEAGFFAWGRSPGRFISFRELKEKIRDLASAENPVRILCTTCFSGGIHTLAWDLDHVCTASTTSFCTVSYSDVQESAFNSAFLEYFSKVHVPHTFADAVRVGYAGDTYNVNMGSLSSTAFMDSVLQLGQYRKELRTLMLNGEIQQDAVCDPNATQDSGSYTVFQAYDFLHGNKNFHSQPPWRTGGRDQIRCSRALVSPSQSFVRWLKLVGDTHTQDVQADQNRNLAKQMRKLHRRMVRLKRYSFPMITENNPIARLVIPKKFLEYTNGELSSLQTDMETLINDHELQNILSRQEVEVYQQDEEAFFEAMTQFKTGQKSLLSLPPISELEAMSPQELELCQERINREAHLKRTLAIELPTMLSNLSRAYGNLRKSSKPLYKYAQTFTRIQGLEYFFLDQNSTVTHLQKEKLLKLLNYEWEDMTQSNTPQ